MKYDKYVRAFPEPLFPELFPENPRIVQILDGVSFPGFTHHVELFTWTKDGTDYYPDKGFEYSLGSLPAESRIWIEDLMKVSPAPQFRTEDGRMLYVHRPMYHTVDEIFVFVGTNHNNIMDLGGEIELWLGIGDRAEKHVINKPSIVYIPAGLVHGPLMARNVRMPIKQLIFYPQPQIREHGVNEWPPDYRPYPETPSRYVDVRNVKLMSLV